MKIHRAWIRATAAAAMAVGTQVAVAQYAPYGAAPQYQYPAQQYPAAQYTAPPATQPVAPYGVTPAQPMAAYPTAQPATAYPTATYPTAAPTAPTQAGPIVQQQVAYPPTQTATPAYPQAQQMQQMQQQSTYVGRGQQMPIQQTPRIAQHSVMGSGYPVVAGRSNGNGAPQNGNLPTPQGNGGEMLPTPVEGSMNGDAASAAGYGPSAGCNCGGYPNSGYVGGGYGGGGYSGGCGDDYGLGGYMEECDGGSSWFGGVYGLYMTRTEPAYRRYTVGVDTAATGTPYFPVPGNTENFSDCDLLIPDWRYGYEIRLGCTFDLGSDCAADAACGYGAGYNTGCDPCNSGCECCQPCCQQQYAWEVAFWSLDRDVQNQYVDGPIVGDFRYYGMVNYSGLQYDEDGAGAGVAAPVNQYYNYQIPITDTGDFGTNQNVLAQRVRTNFWAQNLELNFLRLPFYGGGCDPCGCDPCAPAFSLTGLCGVRWFRMDDDLEFGTEWGDVTTDQPDGWDYNSPNELYHDIQMENNLVGFQLGANMSYTVATRWTAFWDSNFGVYNNYVTQYQRMYNGVNGPVQFIQDGRDFSVRSEKNDLAFLGEMRLGGAYGFTESCRGVLAYRAIAITGVALAPDQIQPAYTDWASTALINADGSIIIHGVQAGVEFCY